MAQLQADMPRTRIDVWCDFVCAHSYIGQHRVASAVAGLANSEAVSIRWRSLELDPRPKAERPTGDLYDYLAQFNGSREAGKAVMNQIAATAAAEGVPFNPDTARPGNTFNAHRLVHLAAACGTADEVVRRLYDAYWVRGYPIADPKTLTMVGVEAGLDADSIARVLAGAEFGAQVLDDQRLARKLGVPGVPYMVVDGKVFPVSTTALRMVLERREREGRPGG